MSLGAIFAVRLQGGRDLQDSLERVRNSAAEEVMIDR